MKRHRSSFVFVGLVGLVAAFAARVGAEHHELDPDILRGQAAPIFGKLPEEAPNAANPFNEAKVDLGRMLYYDPRLSRSQEISCNSCHQLDNFGVDGEPTSPGHKGQRGERNSPTVYNAAFHFSQFWDGRAADVEEQAKGPILNPVEMAMRSEADTVALLKSIPGYPPLFAKAFPGEAEPVSYDNMARAIGAFERRLVTPSRVDAFLAGDSSALSDAEIQGMADFMQTGCIVCHRGAAIGGAAPYQKLGLQNPYPTEDTGRYKVTGVEGDKYFFKVPSLRNVAKTGPWFHDGSVKELDEAIRLMAWHQLGVKLDAAKISSIRTFLEALTGEVDADYVAKPKLPESGPQTPKPDYS